MISNHENILMFVAEVRCDIFFFDCFDLFGSQNCYPNLKKEIPYCYLSNMNQAEC